MIVFYGVLVTNTRLILEAMVALKKGGVFGAPPCTLN